MIAMNKKTFMAAGTVSLLLISFLPLMQNIQSAKCNWCFLDNYPPMISITSPNQNATCSSSFSLLYNVTYDWIFDEVIGSDISSCLTYNLDGKVYVPSNRIVSSYIISIPNTKRNNESQWVMDIRGLEPGMHTLNFTMVLPSIWKYDFPVVGTTFASASVIFNIDASIPNISVLSPTNRSYSKSEIPLAFEVNETTSWIGFSIDELANSTVSGNSTFADLTEGNHSLVVYANDTFGNTGKSETIFFNVALPTTTPSPSPTPSPSISPTPSSTPTLTPLVSSSPEITLEPTQSASSTLEPKNSINYLPIIIGIIIVIIISLAGLLVYFKKIKK